ncbi:MULTISPECIES: hypothetical protein [unclassified Streptomyces]|uniref:hypothetical protein n=1 Tax=unclassified Streptomyces TaxID=2593676 RepID=UPI000F6D1846|nr:MULTISPECIES: hypothetical protein [unclassified Streptomyces]AZM59036.1 hypothetical protein DLM49_05185 [Streptomyces sp. WAC 01438]RSM96855.1 hypothetical protein DMA10_13580 [Streptomyces sp. WAC 01420]
MNTFLQELSKKAAERWATVLLGPGLLFVACVLVGRHQGFTHALDPDRLRAYVTSVSTDRTYQEPAGLIMAAAVVLLGAAVAGLAASSAGGLVERLWLPAGTGRWARPLVRWRLWRWDRRARAYSTAEAEARQELARSRLRGVAAPDRAGELRRLRSRRDAYSEREPDQPTWMAQRMAGAADRVARRYRMDLAEIWPHIWSVADGQVRDDIQGVRDTLAGACRTAAWGAGLLAVAALTHWWPAAVLGLLLLLTGHRRGRAAVDTLVPLVESTVDLYLRETARRLGVACPHTFSAAVADRVIRVLRVGASGT